MRAGQVHDRVTDFVPGALAIFCPACPQIGINIPPEREWNIEEEYVQCLLHMSSHLLLISQMGIPSSDGCGRKYEIGSSPQ